MNEPTVHGMVTLEVDEDTARLGERAGMWDWCGDVFELTPKGVFWLCRLGREGEKHVR